jgi:hypothetical protein
MKFAKNTVIDPAAPIYSGLIRAAAAEISRTTGELA